MRRLLPDPSPPDELLTDDQLLDAYDPAAPEIVRANMVMSLDGAASLDGRSEGLSGSVDKRVFGVLRRWSDVVLVGAGTVATEGYTGRPSSPERRAWRRAHGLVEELRYAVWSPTLSIGPDLPLFDGSGPPALVLTTGRSDPERRAAVAERAEVVLADGSDAVLSALRERGLARVLCEGGPTVLGRLVVDDRLDELCLTLSPLLAGSGPGRVLAGEALRLDSRWTLRSALTAESVLLLRYRRRLSADPD